MILASGGLTILSVTSTNSEDHFPLHKRKKIITFLSLVSGGRQSPHSSRKSNPLRVKLFSKHTVDKIRHLSKNLLKG